MTDRELLAVMSASIAASLEKDFYHASSIHRDELAQRAVAIARAILEEIDSTRPSHVRPVPIP